MLSKKFNANQRRNFILGAAVVVILIAAYGLSRPGVLKNNAPPVNAGNLLGNADTHALGVASLQHSVDNQNSEVDQLKQQVKTLQQTISANQKNGSVQASGLPTPPIPGGGATQNGTGLPPPPVPSVSPNGLSTPYYGPGSRQQAQPVDTSSTPPEIEVMGSGVSSPSAAVGTKGANGLLPTGHTASAQTTAVPTPPVPAQDSGVTTTGAGATNGEAQQKPQTPKVFIPAGTMLTGMLMTGLDAPTGREAASQPVPVLVRIKENAVLPNEYSADYRECFIVASGTGDLSSERAYLRGETLSCVAENGGVIQAHIEMWGTGEDGKAGMRGTLVSKQGSAIAKAILAGFASGLGQAFTPQQQTMITTGSTGGYSSIPVGTAGRMALGNGFSSGANEAAQFFVKLAESEFPVIEVSAGRPVTFIVEKGVELSQLQQGDRQQ